MLFMCLLFLFSLETFAQKLTVKGIVKDVFGEAVIGATVLVVNDDTSTGTVTDIDGNFILENVPDGSMLEVRYIGYISQRQKVEGNKFSCFFFKRRFQNVGRSSSGRLWCTKKISCNCFHR